MAKYKSTHTAHTIISHRIRRDLISTSTSYMRNERMSEQTTFNLCKFMDFVKIILSFGKLFALFFSGKEKKRDDSRTIKVKRLLISGRFTHRKKNTILTVQ